MELINEHRQDSKGNYLIITAKAESGDYKEEMLVNNSIIGLLRTKAQELNNNHQLWYDITGKVSLKEQFRQKAPGTEEICELLRQIEETGKMLENYFLEPDDLVLDMEYIYAEGSGSYYFMYLPGYHLESRKQLEKLLESMMECMDYENHQAVSLVYLLHARSKQKDCGIFSFRQLCDEILRAEEEECCAETIPDLSSGIFENENYERKYYGAENYERKNHEKRTHNQKIKEKFLWKNCKAKLAELLRGTLGKAAGAMKEEYYGVQEEAENSERIPQRITEPKIQKLMKSNKEKAVFPIEELQDTVLLTPEFQDTVLLSEKETAYILKPLEDEKDIIRLSGFPFHFGKECTEHGYVFREAVISRRHARIQQEGAEYYLVDTASLNGTFLNGERLKPNECKKIVPGDILGFADIFYIFTCPESSNVI